jgi:hypothetical protein
MLKESCELGDIPWTGEANKGILQEIDKTLSQGYELKFDPNTKLIIGVDHELFYSSDEYEIPTFNVGDPIARVELSTKTWKSLNKFGTIADKLHLQITGNVLSLSAIAPDGVIAMQTLILDEPLNDGESITFTIPSSALFEAEFVSIEIGQEKILIQSIDRSSIWAIDRSIEPEFFPGLIPEGAIEIAIASKDLKPLLEKGGKLKININKKGAVQLKSTNGKQVIVQIEISCDVPPRTSFQVMAEAVESAIRLIGTAKLITLALPVGLQYIAVSAAAIRCLLPTVVDAAKALTAQQIVSPEPVVLESEHTTVEVEGSEVTMTVSSVEKLDIPEAIEPTSKQEAIDQLKSATQQVEDAISRIPVGSELETAKQAIEETLVGQAQAVLNTEKTQSVFSKEDIKKITNAIARAIARIKAINLNLQTWEIQVTFRT